MADEEYTFTQARNRLEDIVVQVRKKDVSLEHSLDLLEEGVKLASACTELIDHAEWRSVAEDLRADEVGDADEAPSEEASDADETPSEEAGEPS